MNTIDFFRLDGIMAARDWPHFKKEVEYRYGRLCDTHYIDPLEKYNKTWNRPDFDYTFNEFGFRDSPAIEDVDTCYYGCSITAGIGVAESDRWTDLLDTKHNWQSNNFAIPGLSVEECAYLFAQTAMLVKMKRAIFYLPQAARTVIAAHTAKDKSAMQYYRLQPNFCHKNNKNKHSESLSEIYQVAESWYQLPDTYYIDRARTAINLIRYIAELKNIQVTLSSWDHEVYKLLKYPPDTVRVALDHKGRDSSHPGTDYHCLVAKHFEKLLK
jgi:hypothetical protein